MAPKAPPAGRITTTPEEVVDKRPAPKPKPADPPPAAIVDGGDPVDCDEIVAEIDECDEALNIHWAQWVVEEKKEWQRKLCQSCPQEAAEMGLNCDKLLKE